MLKLRCKKQIKNIKINVKLAFSMIYVIILHQFIKYNFKK
jgi:hypothetical protein